MRIHNPNSLMQIGSPTTDKALELASEVPRGFGLWLWKPAIILEELMKLPESNPGLAYLDCGSTLNLSNPIAVQKWLDYENLALRDGIMVFRLNGDNPHRNWTKAECLTHFGVSELADENLFSASVIFVSNTAKGREMVSQWLDACLLNDSALLRDVSDHERENERFREHRHDQSVLSCLLDSVGYRGPLDETYFYPNWRAEGDNFPIWVTRRRTSFTWSSETYLLHGINKVERELVNRFGSFRQRDWNFGSNHRSEI